jgi:Flp pilus assembly protein TadG
MTHPLRFLRNRSGAAIIFVAGAIVMVFAFAVLAIDIGMLLVTKTELQNAADAGALAGAMGMIESLGDSTTAVDYAIRFSGENRAFIGEATGSGNTRGSVVISEEDVSFPSAGLIRVNTHRTEDAGDPLHTIFLDVIDPSSNGFTSVSASATAMYFYKTCTDCLRPWAPPDRWDDADGDGAYDAGEFYDPEITGYKVPADVGAQVVLKLGNGNNDAFGTDWYYAVNFPPINKGNPVSGASQYRSWIQGCVDRTILVEIGDTLRCEPGNMVGPTKAGFDYVISLDPGAHWDSATNQVVGSAFPVSPRIIKAALFNPAVGRISVGGGKCVVVVKLFAFFLEARSSQGDITGRFMQIADPGGDVCDDPDEPSFLYSVKLVQ